MEENFILLLSNIDHLKSKLSFKSQTYFHFEKCILSHLLSILSLIKLLLMIISQLAILFQASKKKNHVRRLIKISIFDKIY